MGHWRPSRPAASDTIFDIPGLMQDNFDAIEDIISQEHETFTETGSGKHRPGRSGVLYRGSTTEIAALSDPPTGAMAFDTTLGLAVHNFESTWQGFGQEKWSRVRAYRSSNVAITADTEAITAVFDVESYDTLNEYDAASGIFTAKASGSYAVIVSISVLASGTQATSEICQPDGNVAVGWHPVPAASANWEVLADASDSTYNVEMASAHTDVVSSVDVSGSIPTSGITGISVAENFRAKRSGCTCNATCYNEGCTCYNTCYSQGCTCNNACYGYSGCSCNATCYEYYKSCYVCNGVCYGYSACSCNYTCYTFTCGCYSTQYGYSGCSCDNTCYSEDSFKPAALLRIGGVDYIGETQQLSADWADYEQIWSTNPSTGLTWTVSGVDAIQGFGYKAIDASTTSGVSGLISDAYVTLRWFPYRPIVTVGLYKGTTLVEAAYYPVHEAGTGSYQTIQLFTIAQLNPGDTLHVRVSKTMENDTIYSHSAFTFFAIHRLSGVCL